MTSAKFTPAALTAIRTSPVRGTGSGASPTFSTSGGPVFVITTCLMAASIAIAGFSLTT